MQSLLNVLDIAKEEHLHKVYWPSSIAVFGPTSPSRIVRNKRSSNLQRFAVAPVNMPASFGALLLPPVSGGCPEPSISRFDQLYRVTRAVVQPIMRWRFSMRRKAGETYECSWRYPSACLYMAPMPSAPPLNWWSWSVEDFGSDFL